MITNCDQNTKNSIVSYYEKKFNLDNISIAYVIISYQKIRAIKHLLLISNQHLLFIPFNTSLQQIVIKYIELSEIQYSITQPNVIKMIISSNYNNIIILSNTIQEPHEYYVLNLLSLYFL